MEVSVGTGPLLLRCKSTKAQYSGEDDEGKG